MGFTWEHVLYRFYSSDGALLYVGITSSINNRFGAHAKSQPWWDEVTDCRVEFFPDRPALSRAELAAIRYERPRYNLRGVPQERVPAAVVVREQAVAAKVIVQIPSQTHADVRPEKRSPSSQESVVQVLPVPYVSPDSSPPRPDAILDDDSWGVYWRLTDGRTIDPRTGEPFFDL